MIHCFILSLSFRVFEAVPPPRNVSNLGFDTED